MATAALVPAPAVSEQSFRYQGWRVALASSACVFVSFASLLVYTFGVFLKPLAAQFHWSRESVSGAFGLAAMSIAVASPFLGMLLDRYPARRIILPCMTVFAGAFASLAFLTPHLFHLYAVFVLLGLVGNGTAHLAYTRALSTWFVERRGAAFSLLLSGGALGAMVLPPVAQMLIGAAGWRAAFASLGALVFAIGIPCGLKVSEQPVASRPSVEEDDGQSVLQGLKSRAFWILVFVLFAASLGQNGSIAHMAALLTDRGVGAGEAAIAVSALGAATLIGRLATGPLLDRFFAPYVAFCLLLTAGVGVFLLANAHGAAGGFGGAVLIGLGMGGEADVTPYLLSRYFGLKSFSTLYGLTWTAYAIAGAIGPVILGRAFDLTHSYTNLLLALAVLTVMGAATMLLLPRYAAIALDRRRH